ncbi:MAG: hypothetical protein AB7V16_08405 [Vulcanibacillus sp.]
MNNIKKLSSKRNAVWLVENGDNLEVVKKFEEEEFFSRELKIYHLLEKEKKIDKFNYPQVIGYNDKEMSIKLQYIQGETFLNRLERYEQNNNIESGKKLMILLFQWIEFFQHSLTKIDYLDQLSSVGIYLDSLDVINNQRTVSLVDINFKNFILKGDKLYGLDFENVSVGEKLTDYTKSLAYMLTYNPIATEYKKRIFIDLLTILNVEYSFSNDLIYKSYNEQLSKIEKRRKLFLEELYII